MSDVQVTPQQIFDSMPQALVPEKAGSTKAVIQFDLSGDQGGKWWVTIHDGQAESGKGDAPEEIVLSDRTVRVPVPRYRMTTSRSPSGSWTAQPPSCRVSSRSRATWASPSRWRACSAARPDRTSHPTVSLPLTPGGERVDCTGEVSRPPPWNPHRVALCPRAFVERLRNGRSESGLLATWDF